MADLDLSGCVRGAHPWLRLCVIEQVSSRGDACVRWCPQCGTVVVDIEQKGRAKVSGGIARERSPEIVKATIKIAKGD